MQQLAKKVVIVTGGGHGIGRQIALTYADAGAQLMLTGRAPAPLEQTRAELERAGAPCLTMVADVKSEADCLRMAAETVNSFGRIDILVNNAGIGGPTARLTEVTLAEWQETIDINLTGAWLAARAVLPQMEKQHSGIILNIGSLAGRRGFSLRSPYAASKWGLIGLTQTMALEWASAGVRVNCLCPGSVEGPRIERVFTARAAATGRPYEDIRREVEGHAAMNRLVTEEEIARVALFLVSDDTSGMTGQTINVDGGIVMS
ncbi:MAG: SDR family oxidoreductase [Candidatus Binataceae bacterium]|jgi:NAD(P)-dependent dehydrogenase (short-subunit alcohol dehydrogenase family)